MPNEQKADQLTGKASIRAGSYQNGEFQHTAAQKAAMGPTPAVTTVSMDVLRDGSYLGAYHHVGDTVDVPADQVETLTLSGFAARADRVAVAQQARDADAAEPNVVNTSTAVAPMTTTDAPKTPATRAKAKR